MVEFCLLRLFPPVPAVRVVPAVETLTRLGDRPCASLGLYTPLCLDRDWREALTLEPEAAVCVVRPAGSLTGRVGDLTFGFMKPMPEEFAWRGGGLFTEVELEAFAAPAVGLVVAVFSGWPAFLSGALLLSFGAASAGLFGAFATVGDFVGFDVVLVIIIGTDLVAALEAPPAAVIEDSLAAALPLPFGSEVPFVASPLRNVVFWLVVAGLLAAGPGTAFARVSSALGLATGVDVGA